MKTLIYISLLLLLFGCSQRAEEKAAAEATESARPAEAGEEADGLITEEAVEETVPIEEITEENQSITDKLDTATVILEDLEEEALSFTWEGTTLSNTVSHDLNVSTETNQSSNMLALSSREEASLQLRSKQKTEEYFELLGLYAQKDIDRDFRKIAKDQIAKIVSKDAMVYWKDVLDIGNHKDLLSKIKKSGSKILIKDIQPSIIKNDVEGHYTSTQLLRVSVNGENHELTVKTSLTSEEKEIDGLPAFIWHFKLIEITSKN